jgi:chorismate mutase/prephenate dehydratase
MGKEKPSKKPSRASSTNSGSARPKSVARIDRKILELLCERARFAQKEGESSAAPGRFATEAAVEEAAINELVQANPGPLTPHCIRAVFREIASGCRSLPTTIKVAYLGPAYSYSHLASIHRFGNQVEQIPVGSISAVFEEVNRGQVDFGIVPLENSTDGRVADTLEMFTRLPVRICGEVQLRIHHYLLGKCPRADIKEVYSRPQALSQCRHWLARHLPIARSIDVTSTSTAAQLAMEKPGAAAIASLQAAVHYGLDVLAERIEDNECNLTRFAVISPEPAARTGRDKTAIMFEIEHRAGTLADALAIFKRARLNLTWIESFPSARQPGGYLFFVELDGHSGDARLKRALEVLERRALRMEILGSYPACAPVE